MPPHHRAPADADAGYIRVSHVDLAAGYTDRDTAIRELVAVRTKEIRDAAAREGKTIPDDLMFVDMDISGKLVEKRPQMLAMLSAAKHGQFSRVWTRTLSRLFRNLGEQIFFLDQLESAGVKIISIQEPLDGEGPVIDLTRNVLGAVNEYISAWTGIQIKESNRTTASMGRWIGGTPPLGYKYDKTSKEILPDPARVQDAIRVFQIYKETQTFIGTASRLNALGIRTRAGALWRQDKVKQILTSPLYRGKVKYDGETWPSKHELIIPQELIDGVDNILMSRAQLQNIPYGMNLTRTYSGLLICGLCGSPMRAQPAKWSTIDYCYWLCSGKKDRGICDMPTYRTEELDLFILEGIKLSITHELENLKRFAEECPVEEYSARNINTDAHSIRARKASINGKIMSLATEHAEGFLPQPQYRALITRYQAELDELEKESKKAEPKRISAADVVSFRDNLAATWEEATEQERQTLIRTVSPKIRVYPDKLLLHTVLSLGDVTIPTQMFERIQHTEEGGNLCHGAPDRTITCTPLKVPAYILSAAGRRIRFQNTSAVTP